MKRVWLNLNTGNFSDSWDKGGLLDIVDDKMMADAKEKGWKLIEYTCVNDPDFVLYDRMRIIDKSLTTK